MQKKIDLENVLSASTKNMYLLWRLAHHLENKKKHRCSGVSGCVELFLRQCFNRILLLLHCLSCDVNIVALYVLLVYVLFCFVLFLFQFIMQTCILYTLFDINMESSTIHTHLTSIWVHVHSFDINMRSCTSIWHQYGGMNNHLTSIWGHAHSFVNNMRSNTLIWHQYGVMYTH